MCTSGAPTNAPGLYGPGGYFCAIVDEVSEQNVTAYINNQG